MEKVAYLTYRHSAYRLQVRNQAHQVNPETLPADCSLTERFSWIGCILLPTYPTVPLDEEMVSHHRLHRGNVHYLMTPLYRSST